MRVLLIIPAYNEEASILRVCRSITHYNETHRTNFDYLVINDCSTDHTSAICHAHHIPVIDLIHNLGIGGAVQTGYKYALEHDYDIAIQFDGDGQHNVAHVPNLIKPLENHTADLVIGSRFIDRTAGDFQSSKTRQFGIKIISQFIKFVTGRTIKDTTSGFRAANHTVIREFAQSYPTEYPEPITTAELLKMGYRIAEVPVAMNARTAGQSSINSWKTVYYMVNVCLSLLVIKIRRFQKCQSA